MVIVAVAQHIRAHASREEVEKFSLVRMASLLMLGVNNVPIDDELVDPLAPHDELVALDDMLVVRENIAGRAHGAF
jgi:hypothetical protein